MEASCGESTCLMERGIILHHGREIVQSSGQPGATATKGGDRQRCPALGGPEARIMALERAMCIRILVHSTPSFTALGSGLGKGEGWLSDRVLA